jgi:gamma-glutamylcyclotransferase (GGCT)/AIG2-like uncharacterized protein YtfP
VPISNPFLFVYGSLRRGGLRHSLLLGAGARPVADGSISGKLFDFGKYPGAVKSADRKRRIRGEVYAFADPPSGIVRVDKIEGFFPGRAGKSAFVRRLVEVELDGGKSLEAWAYFYNRPVKRARELSNGEWLARV